uniref:Uncharacterized protein n=1 Tax=Anguilla anguilla TaxID=7936 RepID=A0A0E9QAN3_ANGAN
MKISYPRYLNVYNQYKRVSCTFHYLVYDSLC